MKISTIICLAVAALLLSSSSVMAQAKNAPKKGMDADSPSASGGKAGYFGDEGYMKSGVAKDVKLNAAPIDRDSFMALHPRSYDHAPQPYTAHGFKGATPTYYRVSPYGRTNEYYRGSPSL